MANPTWFDETFYLNGKLAQLKAVDPEGKLNDGKAWSSVDGVKAALEAAGYKGDEGLYQHFVDHGMDENISPMEGFDVMFYLQSKADALNAVKYEGKEWDAASVMDAFKAAGIESAWEHYQMFGSSEGIATSADFDSAAYFVAKVKQLNDTAYEGRSNWTVDEVKAAFAEQGLTALEHYQLYGKDEKLDPADFDTTAKDPDGSFDIYTGVKIYVTLEDALAAQADGSLAENYTIKSYTDAGDVTVAQQAGIADLLAGATPAIKADPTYTLVDTVDAIANASAAVLMGSEVLSEDGKSYESGYKIADTLANITAAADGSLVKNAAAVTVTDLGDNGITVKDIDNYVDGSDTGFVSTADKLDEPWMTASSNDLLVATNDKAIDFEGLKNLVDWGQAESFIKAMGNAENILEGGRGNDVLVGKDGAKDVFLFNSWVKDTSNEFDVANVGGIQLGQDTIYNFEIGTDKLLIHESDRGKFVDATNLEQYIDYKATDDGTGVKIIVDSTFFGGGELENVTADLTITLMGVTEAGAREAGDKLFAFAAE
ncbi:hypothetical protein [Desulfovibrio sp.]|uniref:hypothetical protein n=1 Tax=Desulfovibrio sp. TaxID=885 RepID=UPI003AB2D811